MTTQHTPGPWTYSPPDDQVQDLFAEEYFFIEGPGSDVHGLMTVANARLISAAPDLLAALQSVVSHLAPAWCKEARAAIAQATGGEAC